MSDSVTRDFLCNLTADDPPVQENWKLGKNYLVLLIPFVAVLFLVIGAFIIL
jgi:hypothetical protein